MKLIYTDIELDAALALFETSCTGDIQNHPAVEALLMFDRDEEPGTVVQELLSAINSLPQCDRGNEWRVYNIETGGSVWLYAIVNRFQSFRFN